MTFGGKFELVLTALWRRAMAQLNSASTLEEVRFADSTIGFSTMSTVEAPHCSVAMAGHRGPRIARLRTLERDEQKGIRHSTFKKKMRSRRVPENQPRQ